MANSAPLVEEFYLGEPNLEAYYTRWPLSAMAVQPALSSVCKRARYVEAHGYHRKPPLSGERQCYVNRSGAVDEISVAAIRRGLKDCITDEEVASIKEAYVDSGSSAGDAWWIADRCEQHPYVVIAVLRRLNSLGQLPPKFS